MHANKPQEIEDVRAGDIAAAIGLKETRTGDTLCDEAHPIILEAMRFRIPSSRSPIEPKTKADQDKLGIALAKLSEEIRPSACTPIRKTRTSAVWARLHPRSSLSACGGVQVDANVGRRRWPTARPSGKRRRIHRRQVHPPDGGRGQYGHVVIHMGRASPHRIRVRDNIVGIDPQGIHRTGGAGLKERWRTASSPAIRWWRGGGAGGRLLPRRGLERNGVQDRRLDGGERSGAPGASISARADH